ncbi:MAG: class I SAM-dependent methyltransferase [Nitrospirota bacterium]
MELDVTNIAGTYQQTRERRRSRHSVADRIAPRRTQYDYLVLDSLQQSIRHLIDRCPPGNGVGKALDLGASRSPYKSLLEANGYAVSTLDIDVDGGADCVGTVEETGLPDESFDLVICTQVLEHCLNPWGGIREIRRILKPSGVLVASVPHVWFYHPHPTDNWRFTQEGILHLCDMGGLKPESLLSQGGSVMALFQIVNFLAYGVLGRLGMPLYFLSNCVAEILDRLAANTTFCLNFACLAAKPGQSS